MIKRDCCEARQSLKWIVRDYGGCNYEGAGTTNVYG